MGRLTKMLVLFAAVALIAVFVILVLPDKKKTWTDPVTGMEFVWVPGGCFQMGQTEAGKRQIINEKGVKAYNKWYTNDLPRHEVCVDGFWMGRYEVTNAQYRKFKPGHDSKDFEGKSLNGEDQPVVYVSWKDAMDFAQWLSQKCNRQFRLPTEAEWEYACRAGTTTVRYWGDDPDSACAYENVRDRASERGFDSPRKNYNCDDGHAVAAPVGSFRPNDFGLYDMLGNVCEYCADWYDENAYSRHSRNNPIYDSGGSGGVVRSGCWLNAFKDVRCARRFGGHSDVRLSLSGFRLVRTN